MELNTPTSCAIVATLLNSIIALSSRQMSGCQAASETVASRLLLTRHSLFQICPVPRGYADLVGDARRVFMIQGIWSLRSFGDPPNCAASRSSVRCRSVTFLLPQHSCWLLGSMRRKLFHPKTLPKNVAHLIGHGHPRHPIRVSRSDFQFLLDAVLVSHSTLLRVEVRQSG